MFPARSKPFLLSRVSARLPHLPPITSLRGLTEARNWKALISRAPGVAAEHGLLRHVRVALPHGRWRPPGRAGGERGGRPDGNRGMDGWMQPSCSLRNVRRKATCLQAVIGPRQPWGKTSWVLTGTLLFFFGFVFSPVWHNVLRSILSQTLRPWEQLSGNRKW